MPIIDRNEPEAVAWLDVCRALRPELTREQFEVLVPEFIRLHNELEADLKRRLAH